MHASEAAAHAAMICQQGAPEDILKLFQHLEKGALCTAENAAAIAESYKRHKAYYDRQSLSYETYWAHWVILSQTFKDVLKEALHQKNLDTLIYQSPLLTSADFIQALQNLSYCTFTTQEEFDRFFIADARLTEILFRGQQFGAALKQSSNILSSGGNVMARDARAVYPVAGSLIQQIPPETQAAWLDHLRDTRNQAIQSTFQTGTPAQQRQAIQEAVTRLTLLEGIVQQECAEKPFEWDSTEAYLQQLKADIQWDSIKDPKTAGDPYVTLSQFFTDAPKLLEGIFEDLQTKQLRTSAHHRAMLAATSPSGKPTGYYLPTFIVWLGMLRRWDLVTQTRLTALCQWVSVLAGNNIQIHQQQFTASFKKKDLPAPVVAAAFALICQTCEQMQQAVAGDLNLKHLDPEQQRIEIRGYVSLAADICFNSECLKSVKSLLEHSAAPQDEPLAEAIFKSIWPLYCAQQLTPVHCNKLQQAAKQQPDAESQKTFWNQCRKLLSRLQGRTGTGGLLSDLAICTAILTHLDIFTDAAFVARLSKLLREQGKQSALHPCEQRGLWQVLFHTCEQASGQSQATIVSAVIRQMNASSTARPDEEMPQQNISSLTHFFQQLTTTSDNPEEDTLKGPSPSGS
jgi:hypothetical protein